MVKVLHTITESHAHRVGCHVHASHLSAWLQVGFMSFALGSGVGYNTARMDASHERLILQQGMTMEAFDITLGHLAASLQDLGVPEVRWTHCAVCFLWCFLDQDHLLLCLPR